MTKYIIVEVFTNYQFHVTERVVTTTRKDNPLIEEPAEFKSLANALEYIELLNKKNPHRNLTMKTIYTN